MSSAKYREGAALSEQTKVSGLTPHNVDAIREVFRSQLVSGAIVLGKTFAVFHMEAHEAAELVGTAITRLPGRGHPKASLHAIHRKLAAQAHESILEQKIREEEEEHQEQLDNEFVVPEDTSSLSIDRAALFLCDMTYLNMFEARGVKGHPGLRADYCKVCGEQVPRNRQEAHHAGHKRDRSRYNTERIHARKESSMATKTTKVKPIDQGIPAVYLNEDGSKFSPPGADAKLKRDLIAAIDGLDNPNGLHKFDPTEAAKILAARGWNDWLIKSRKSRESQAMKKASREAKAAETAKAKAAAKRSGSSSTTSTREVTPDPKPKRRQTARGRRSR